MGQTFLANLLLKTNPVLHLMKTCSSFHVVSCQKLLLTSCWKNPVTRRCTSSSGCCLQRIRHDQSCRPLVCNLSSTTAQTSVRWYSSDAQKKKKEGSGKGSERSEHDAVSEERPSLFKRFKQMYRDYWYVLLPVHVVTSIGWFGAFYYMCISGVDVTAILENLNVSERIINPLRDSKAGYLALSYALYKIATPLRYTVTLGGTTVSINYLKKWGYIKPIPAREKLKEMYDEQKENLKEMYDEKKENLMERKDAIMKDTADQLRERRDSFIKNYRSKK